ncbi:MAG: hypothetical protein MJ252_27740, partial [archaeon]|nr:hypothetical protein [archaeon]
VVDVAKKVLNLREKLKSKRSSMDLPSSPSKQNKTNTNICNTNPTLNSLREPSNNASLNSSKQRKILKA